MTTKNTITQSTVPITISGQKRENMTLETPVLDIALIGSQNDVFRSNLGACHADGLAISGKIALSSEISKLPQKLREQIILAARDYDEFSIDIDPCAEHCFGTIKHPVIGKILWSIEYYKDASCEDQANELDIAQNSYRVLTIMLDEEW